ncbi:GHMP kinases N terminal domain [Trypanosoma vivax]|uniref:phosphomevalonate kinase n=1 Tax=Trypanosoma vivax (strain Y486) TaxID=1055687 RepID=G0U256_TRYVY|nr:GHMP kinases N terminal domain [Trypanosoma vivax]CCC50359.1 putative phosphomevalonate kinase-like protein [Trypanosoma vivax Y486]
MITASCPGKVLIVGGYLIVETGNVGVSLGTTARFTTRVLSVDVHADDWCRIHVVSPQFGTEFTFKCSKDSDTDLVNIEQLSGKESPFLYFSVLYSVAAAVLRGFDIRFKVTLELLADNDFYSQRKYLEAQGKAVTMENLRAIPSYVPLVGCVSKTGLGSSAAMSTSTVACLVRLFNLRSNNASTVVDGGQALPQVGSFPLGDAEEVELVHRISQIAHCAAQAKIGSGFDVFTATYGTCVYRRFPPRFIEKIFTGCESTSSLAPSLLQECVSAKEAWVEHTPFRLPTDLELLLGDIHQGGTPTPGMVSKVTAWRRKQGASCDGLWERLRENNEEYVTALAKLADYARKKTEEYQKSVEVLQQVVLTHHDPINNCEKLWIEAARLASESRRLLREMGKAAGAEIEPTSLGKLLDATVELPGVFAVGCPGAGGYDAVFALTLGKEVRKAVERFWEGYNGLQVCPLLLCEDSSGLILS